MKTRICAHGLLTGMLLMVSQPLLAAQPTVSQALGLKPMQADVEYDRPEADQASRCTIKSETQGNASSWVVRDEQGAMLRRFADTNQDNKVDLWCYYKEGIEVYRDIDADFNGKADQYRWFGTGGMRWGLDQNEDGRIDRWKWISPEEVTAEAIRALRDGDAQRFSALLMSGEEIEALGLGDQLSKQLRERVEKAASQFASLSDLQAKVGKQARWLDFSAPTPGVVPAGTDQLQQDVVVYENVVALIEAEGKQHEQIPIGTLVKVQDSWRLIDVPGGTTGFFFTINRQAAVNTLAGVGQDNEKIQRLVEQLEAADKRLADARTASQIAQLNKRRADLLRQLAEASQGEDREIWLLQLVDSVSALAQSGDNPEATQQLRTLEEEIRRDSTNQELLAHARFALLTADYSTSLQASDADYAAIQQQWLTSLEEFVGQFPQAREAAEAMLQLAIALEFAGRDDDAKKWYARLSQDFGDSDLATKAVGAQRRLDSVGKSINLRGRGLDGRPLELASLRGNLVLVHYWATWCEPCKQDMESLKQLQARYSRANFRLLGVNVDNEPRDAVAYMRSQKIAWPQLHESGGLDSSLATQLGIFTLPVMMLIDENGVVLNRGITIAELEDELKKQLR